MHELLPEATAAAQPTTTVSPVPREHVDLEVSTQLAGAKAAHYNVVYG